MSEIVNKIISWFTKGAYSTPIQYTNTVKCTNKSSNLDYLYGPYKLPEGVTEPTLELLPDDLKKTLYPGKTFGIEKNGKIIEYWAQLQDKVVQTDGYKFDEVVNTPENYDLVLKQCVDLDDVEVTRIPASYIDALFDDNPNEPEVDQDYLNEEQGPTGGTGGTEGTEGEGTDFNPENPPEPEPTGGTEE